MLYRILSSCANFLAYTGLLLLNFFPIFLLSQQPTIDWDPISNLPASYKGRFRSIEAYSRMWLEDFYGSQHLEKDTVHSLGWSDASALNVLLNFHFNGLSHYKDIPLIEIKSKELKNLLGLSTSESRFTYSLLFGALHTNENIRIETILSQKDPLEDTSEGKKFGKKTREELLHLLQVLSNFSQMEQVDPPKNSDPMSKKIPQAGVTLKMLPSHYQPGEWVSLKAFDLSETTTNFTAFTDDDFHALRLTYHQMENAFRSGSTDLNDKIREFSQAYQQAYTQLPKEPYLALTHSNFYYPSPSQLKAETFYYRFPLFQITLATYGLSCLLFLFSFLFASDRTANIGFAAFLLAVLLHTFILVLRIYILQRPPVSNMYETVMYVPWISSMTCFCLAGYYRRKILIFAGSIVSFTLMSLLEITHISGSLDVIQPVLNSQYWLIVHVLMVVGSYGVFCLAGVIGHFYLISYLFSPRKIERRILLGKFLLQSLFIGLILLIAGTLLGGVWAAESWGRFWDWDPKESWAFISICIYLIWIHAYMFKHIGDFGLAIGSIVGLQAITFTWYGVNYLLGTGLHSYGFGSGGEWAYYLFLLCEILFLLGALYVYSLRASKVDKI